MKRKTLIIGGIVIVILAIVGFWGWQRLTASPTTAAAVQTATVTRGSLTAIVSAAGNVSAPASVALAFQTSGRVTKVNVQVGAVVKKDQLLMQLDTVDLDSSLKSAQINFASAQANYDQTKNDLQYALRNAQSSLTSSQSSLDAAKAKNDQNPSTLIISRVALDRAQVALDKAQSDYNSIAWRSDAGMTPQAQTLSSATSDYRSALANYNLTAATINDSALKQAQASYNNAQVALDQAQKNLDSKIVTAQAEVDNAKNSVDQAQRNLDKAKIIAPFDGVVAAVNFSVGDTSSGTAVTVVDMSRLQVKVTVAEVDISKIKAGQPAQMTLDALAGKTYDAKVLSIGPVATVTQGVVNYPVVVTITNSDGAIKPGMTANLTIVVEQRDNVLLVPLRSVRTQGNQRTVTVVNQGKNTSVPVTTGLSNDTSVEITGAGLKEGDRVILNQTTTRQTTGGGPAGGFPGGPPD